MAQRLDRKSVNMPIHSCVADVVRTACMATSSARMMVRVSYICSRDIYVDSGTGGDVDNHRT